MKKIIVDFDDVAGGLSRIYKCHDYKINYDADFMQLTQAKEISVINYTSGYNAEFEEETLNELIFIKLSDVVQIIVTDTK